MSSTTPKKRNIDVDLSALSQLDATYGTPVGKTAVQTPAPTVQTTNQANLNVPVTKKLSNRLVTGKRVRVKASKTSFFKGNPRVFCRNLDISDLLPLIQRTGGNSEAVSGRMVGDSIEVIAGYRRRQCCIDAGLELTVDVYDDITDEEAFEIAEIENSGRKDIDLISDCEYLHFKYETQKSEDSALTIDIFAIINNTSRTTLYEKFAVANLPEFLKASSHNQTWTLRKLNKLVQYYKSFKDESLIEKAKRELPVTNPDNVLKVLKEIKESVEPPKPVDKFKLSKGKNGFITLKSNESLSDEQIKRLEEFIKTL